MDNFTLTKIPQNIQKFAHSGGLWILRILLNQLQNYAVLMKDKEYREKAINADIYSKIISNSIIAFLPTRFKRHFYICYHGHKDHPEVKLIDDMIAEGFSLEDLVQRLENVCLLILKEHLTDFTSIYPYRNKSDKILYKKIDLLLDEFFKSYNITAPIIMEFFPECVLKTEDDTEEDIIVLKRY